MFEFGLTEDLRIKIRKLFRKDKKKAEIINKKIKEIISNNSQSIERYKNLRGNQKEYKRVHIDKHFILLFKVDKEDNFILFEDFDHHDNIY